jgi:hypothetical protein
MSFFWEIRDRDQVDSIVVETIILGIKACNPYIQRGPLYSICSQARNKQILGPGRSVAFCSKSK